LVDVDDLVALLEQMLNNPMAGFAAAASDKDAFGGRAHERNKRSRGLELTEEGRASRGKVSSVTVNGLFSGRSWVLS
jgi:hypothetical protein